MLILSIAELKSILFAWYLNQTWRKPLDYFRSYYWADLVR